MARFFAVGYHLHPDAASESFRHAEEVSLDDADVVLFGLPRAPYADDTYLGRPRLSDYRSFWYMELLGRWRTELLSAVNAGKTVFVVLTAPQSVYVATGDVEVSGTGRNAQRKRSNTDALPCSLDGVVPGVGSEIRGVPRSRVLRAYWTRFGPLSRYEMRFSPKEGLKPLLTTRNPEQVVSAVFTSKNGGHLVLLPPMDLGNDDEDYDDEDEEEEPDDGRADSTDDSPFRLNSIDLVRRLLEVDAELRGGAPSPPPDWAQATQYETATQRGLREELLKAQEAEAQARRRLEELADSLGEASVLQGLLYAQGRPLEDAVLRALKLMGVDAARVAEGDSEFDAVFTIDGRRILGEVEGRDKAAIAIEKITQLERNIAEDFARGDVAEHAHGVLFGNPQRVVPPDERTKTFTARCITSAERSGFALVLTHTMFEPAAYLEANNDAEYAASCRVAIANTNGELVEFPEVPVTQPDEPRPTEAS